MSCGSCGLEWDPEPQPEHGSLVGGELLMPQFRCPRCEAAGAEVLRGNELEVESIEVENVRGSSADASGSAERAGPRAGHEPTPEPEELRMHRTKIKVAEDALDANTTIAHANRADFDREGVAVVNLMSAPGAGKTTLLERTLAERGETRVGVLEGDVQGSLDADRLSALHVPVVQLNTDGGFGGECHLDANMVRTAIPDLDLPRSTCW